MVDDSNSYRPFSQRMGLAPIPPQLALGEVSDEIRRLLDYYLTLEFRRTAYSEAGERLMMDLHVRLLKLPISTFEHESSELQEEISKLIAKWSIGPLFDLVEFLVRHPLCSAELKQNITTTFVDARAAYRVVDYRHITVIGTHEQAHAYEEALSAADESGAGAARSHLIAAGVALRNADWAGSVRESIHAVEAAAVRLSPSSNTLGTALNALERRGHLHGSLKKAFGALYGYTSDEEGVRHALVLQDTPQVDETDALFMLGACASFISYVLAREAQNPLAESHRSPGSPRVSPSS